MLNIKVGDKGVYIQADGSVAKILDDSARAVRALYASMEEKGHGDIFKEFIKFTINRDDFFEEKADDDKESEEKDDSEVPEDVKDALSKVLQWIAQ